MPGTLTPKAERVWAAEHQLRIAKNRAFLAKQEYRRLARDNRSTQGAIEVAAQRFADDKLAVDRADTALFVARAI